MYIYYYTVYCIKSPSWMNHGARICYRQTCLYIDRRKGLCNITWVFKHNVPASDQHPTSNLKWTDKHRPLTSSPSLAETSLGVGDLNSQLLVWCAMPVCIRILMIHLPTHPKQERKNSAHSNAAITETSSFFELSIWIPCNDSIDISGLYMGISCFSLAPVHEHGA